MWPLELFVAAMPYFANSFERATKNYGTKPTSQKLYKYKAFNPTTAAIARLRRPVLFQSSIV